MAGWVMFGVLLLVGAGAIAVFYKVPILLPPVPPSGRVTSEWFPFGLTCDACSRRVPNGDPYWTDPVDPLTELYLCHDCASVPV